MEHITSSRVDFPTWRRTENDDEEIVNAITHGFGLVAALVGSLVMLAGVSTNGDIWLSIGCAAYLFTLVAVYAMSTLSHSTDSPRWKPLFRQLDQAFIYLLIVGSYTPYSLAYLRGGFWWVLLGLMWCVALVGFVSKAFFAHQIDGGSVSSYLFLGWMPIISLPTIWQLAPASEFAFIVAGGACYMLGTFFLLNDERVRHFHAAWHVLVIAGSACHFLGVQMFVVQAAN